MTEKKREIISLLKEATNSEKPLDAGKKINLKIISILLFLLFVVTASISLYAYFDMKKKLNDLRSDIKEKITDSLNRAKQLEEEKKYIAAKEVYLSVSGLDINNDVINEKIAERDRKMQIYKEMRSYINKLQINVISFTNKGGEFKVSGKILNTGSREVDDIELTFFCLDKNDKPVCEKQYTAVSHDGKPLKKYQHRRFKISIDNAPKSAKDVQVIVSDIEFHK